MTEQSQAADQPLPGIPAEADEPAGYAGAVGAADADADAVRSGADLDDGADRGDIDELQANAREANPVPTGIDDVRADIERSGGDPGDAGR